MKTALFSVSYAGLWGQEALCLEDFICKAAALGYQGVELMGKRPHASPLDITPDGRKALRDLLGERGVEVACVAAYTDFTGGLRAAEVPFGEMQVAYVAALAQMAADLGGNLVRVFTGYDDTARDFTLQWDLCVRAVRECCHRAADLGVTIGVQNHHDIAVHTAALREFIAEVHRPNCRAMFDAWSPALRGEDLRAAAQAMAPLMAYTTCADYVRLPRFHYRPAYVNYAAAECDHVRAVPMGEGCIDYKAFFAGLKAGVYDGWIAYEMCSPLRGGGSEENLDACARRFLEYVNATWQALGAARSLP